MTIDLSDLETGAKYGGGYDADLAKLQKRLERIQVAHIVEATRHWSCWEVGTRPAKVARSSA